MKRPGRAPQPIGVVAYLRVSTRGQEASGLGLDDQRATVAAQIRHNGWRLIAEYRETESGRRNDRPELAKAIAHARRADALLLIAKLDRLSRDAGFLMTLRNSGADVRACDMPHAGTLEFGIRAVFAQHEREEISRRTRAALAIAKARGTRLGNPRWKASISKARAARVAKARERAAALAAVIAGIRKTGATLQEIAAALNERGIQRRSGREWNVSAVHRLIRLQDAIRSRPR